MSFESYGKYQLLKKLATGGMAEIWLARQQGLEGFEKHLVVKRILPHLAENEEFINMFLDEARIAARLNHPNIVQIFDLGAEGDTYFIAMEFIHGEDVRRVWKRADAAGKPIPVPLVCRIIMDAAAGLDYAHKKLDQAGRPLNIVHRDISPQNILATFEGGVKVVDFGIAKAADQATVTRSGVLKGKYSYMSPEQAAGKKIDSRTDVFALGVVLYELLTGTRLFKRGNDIATLNAVTECAVEPPSKVNNRLPQDLDPVVMKALEKDVDKRYQDAASLQSALEDWLVQHKIPSGSSHLSTFMQDIYAERLKREAEEGKFLLDDLDASRNRSAETADEAVGGGNKATPVSKPSGGPRPTASLRARELQYGPKPIPGGITAPPVVDPEATMAAPDGEAGSLPQPSRARSKSSASISRSNSKDKQPSRVGDKQPSKSGDKQPSRSLGGKPRTSQNLPPVLAQPPPDPGGGTEVSATIRRGKALPALVAGGSLLVGLGIAAAIFLANGRAEVTLESEPPGANVSFDHKTLPCMTPCVLPERPAGRYDATLTLAGFKDKETIVEIPRDKGQSTFKVKLDPMEKKDDKSVKPVKPVAVVTDAPDAAVAVIEPTATPDAGVAVKPPPSKVLLVINSDPLGAKATVDGKAVGTTPTQLEVEPNSKVTIGLQLSGHKDFKDTVQIGASGKTEKTFALKKTEAVVHNTPNPNPNPNPNPGPGPGPTVSPRNTGTVRFVVKPWATVICNASGGGNYKLGDTPFEEKTLPAGSYTCTFSNPDLGVRQKDVVVLANDLTKVLVNF